VRWNGQARNTGFVNSTQLRVTLTSADLAIASMGVITVRNPGGEFSDIVSNPLCFTITPTGSILLGQGLVPDQQSITYTVTPSGTTPDGRPVSFSPTNRTFTGLTGDVTDANFLAIIGQLSIDGTVRTPNNSRLAQVKVMLLFEDPQTRIYQPFADYDTAADGVFAFANLTGGYAYRIVPQRAGYSFRFPDFSDLPVLDIPNLTAGLPGLQCLGQLAALAPEVTTNPATNITTTTAMLNGTVNPNGAMTQVSFEYATSADFSGAQTISAGSLAAGASPQPVSANLTNLTPGTTYFFRVVASNSAGTTRGSALGFTTVSCNYPINPTSQNFAATGGNGSVNVTAGAGCTWTAVRNDAWISITGGASGAGNGTVNYTVEANTGPQRMGTVTIAGQTFTVIQDNGCVF